MPKTATATKKAPAPALEGLAEEVSLLKFSCTTKLLSDRLNDVARAVPSRPSHHILANVLINADKQTQRVSLTAFDLSLGIETTFPAQVEVGGKLTLPAKLLGDIVARLPDGDLTITRKQTETAQVAVSLRCQAGVYDLRGEEASEFPELPETAGQFLLLAADTLQQGLAGTLYASSTDESKQVLAGIHFSGSKAQGLELASTDGHRLARVQLGDFSEELHLTIPAKALQELKSLLGSVDATVKLYVQSALVVFAWEGYRLTSRLLEGQYPNYNQLIPQRFERTVTVDRKALLEALARIAVLAGQSKNNCVTFEIDPSKEGVTLSANAQDVGNGEEVVAAQMTGESLMIAFDARYLSEALKVITCAEVLISFNTATSPVVIKPLNDSFCLALLMPVQVRAA